MKTYEAGIMRSIDISTQASAEKEWQELDPHTLPPRSVLLSTEHFSEPLHIEEILSTGCVQAVQVAGETAADGRILDFQALKMLRQQCIAADTPFYFLSTGANFQMNGRVYHIPEGLQKAQAMKSGMNYFPLCLAMNPPVRGIAENRLQRSPSLLDADGFMPVSGSPFDDTVTAEEAALPQEEAADFWGSEEHPQVKNLHYPIEVTDDDEDEQGASPEDHRLLEESERARKAGAPVQYYQEALRFSKDGNHP